jgi:hypothetical protein
MRVPARSSQTTGKSYRVGTCQHGASAEPHAVPRAGRPEVGELGELGNLGELDGAELLRDALTPNRHPEGTRPVGVGRGGSVLSRAAGGTGGEGRSDDLQG